MSGLAATQPSQRASVTAASFGHLPARPARRRPTWRDPAPPRRPAQRQVVAAPASPSPAASRSRACNATQPAPGQRLLVHRPAAAVRRASPRARPRRPPTPPPGSGFMGWSGTRRAPASPSFGSAGHCKRLPAAMQERADPPRAGRRRWALTLPGARAGARRGSTTTRHGAPPFPAGRTRGPMGRQARDGGEALAAGWLLRCVARRRWRAWLALALIVGAFAGVVEAAAAACAADRFRLPEPARLERRAGRPAVLWPRPVRDVRSVLAGGGCAAPAGGPVRRGGWVQRRDACRRVPAGPREQHGARQLLAPQDPGRAPA